MQTASDLKQRGVKRTKLTRSDGTASVSIESPALTRKMFPPEDGFTVSVVYGYDADLDGLPRPENSRADLLAKLDQDELDELLAWLELGWDRAIEVHGYGVDVTYETETAFTLAANESKGRRLGCRWSACAVCHHASCGFCPACNPGQIAPNGEAYDDEDGE